MWEAWKECEELSAGHSKLEMGCHESEKSLHSLNSFCMSGTGRSISRILPNVLLTLALLPSLF